MTAFGESSANADIQSCRQSPDVRLGKDRLVLTRDFVNLDPSFCELGPAVVGGVFIAVAGILRTKECDPSRVGVEFICGEGTPVCPLYQVQSTELG